MRSGPEVEPVSALREEATHFPELQLREDQESGPRQPPTKPAPGGWSHQGGALHAVRHLAVLAQEEALEADGAARAVAPDQLQRREQLRAALKSSRRQRRGPRTLLTGRKVAWRDELQASAEAKVEAARAEAEALKRRFSAREGELEQLRAELERVRAQQQDALEKARRAEEEARAAAERARAEQQHKLREELALREVEADEKARANVEAALGEAAARCPRAVMEGFLVAERTFQKALYTDLPAAAVAVLYAGALERALYTLFVDRFRTWLKGQGRLEDFLRGATRERRGTRVQYFDHFVEAFDEERPGRAPSMGEVGRVLARRHELYLRRFDEYLKSTWGDDDAFFDALAQFVQRTKEELRDPVAHGRGDAVGYDLLRRFRERGRCRHRRHRASCRRRRSQRRSFRWPCDRPRGTRGRQARARSGRGEVRPDPHRETRTGGVRVSPSFRRGGSAPSARLPHS